jgi:flagellar motor switch/type III secretory pathway protein FliN
MKRDVSESLTSFLTPVVLQPPKFPVRVIDRIEENEIDHAEETTKTFKLSWVSNAAFFSRITLKSKFGKWVAFFHLKAPDIDELSLLQLKAGRPNRFDVYLNGLLGELLKATESTIEDVMFLDESTKGLKFSGWVCMQTHQNARTVFAIEEKIVSSTMQLWSRDPVKQIPKTFISLVCRIGSWSLKKTRYELMDIGDVLLTSLDAAEHSGPVVLESSTANISITAVLSGQNTTIIGRTSMSEPNSNQPYFEDAKIVDTEESYIEISASTDGVSIPLSRLLSLQRGDVIKLQQSVSNAKVNIRANGRSIGSGTLVEIGSQLGIQIESLRHPK